jgi:hypothetical protein
MGLLDRIQTLTDHGPVQRHDRPHWAATQTLHDIAELTARWLAGEIQSQPGYFGTVDVDEDEAPGLTETLITLNQAGYLTQSSQAGADCISYDGRRWTQLAAVCGSADDNTHQWLHDIVANTHFNILAGHCERHGPRVAVTWIDGQPHTHFGVNSKNDVRFAYQECGDAAIDAACAAWQVTIYDPQPGRNEMWEYLRHAASE